MNPAKNNKPPYVWLSWNELFIYWFIFVRELYQMQQIQQLMNKAQQIPFDSIPNPIQFSTPFFSVIKSNFAKIQMIKITKWHSQKISILSRCIVDKYFTKIICLPDNWNEFVLLLNNLFVYVDFFSLTQKLNVCNVNLFDMFVSIVCEVENGKDS